MMRIIIDNQVTRRIFMNYVLDDENELLFASKHVSQCIQYALHHEETSVVIECEHGEFLLSLADTSA